MLKSLLTVAFVCLATAQAGNHTHHNGTHPHHHNHTTTAVPTPTFITPPPPGETYVVGYPICNVSGYTEVPGLYTETIEQQSGATFESCFESCKHNSTCKSIAWAPHYTECLWFNMIVEDTQLWEDDGSYFDHYDLGCKWE